MDHALKVYSMSNNYLAERARVSFKRSRVLRSQRKTDEADKELRNCFRIYSEFISDRVLFTGKQKVVKGRMEDLVDSDFDGVVAFWFK